MLEESDRFMIQQLLGRSFGMEVGVQLDEQELARVIAAIRAEGKKRVDELLAANNKYLERARAAETDLHVLRQRANRPPDFKA